MIIRNSHQSHIKLANAANHKNLFGAVFCIFKNNASFGLVVFSICLFLSSNIFAQEKETVSTTGPNSVNKVFKHAINTCPGGIAFGIYSVNYEYLFNPYHGLVGRFDYEAIPKSYTDASIEASGIAFILNYRWHRTGELNSEYLGVFARYRSYEGDGTLESTEFDFTLPSLTLGLNVGKRWVWDSGFNLNLAFGYGFSLDSRDVTPSHSAFESRIDTFEKEYDFINPFLGEFSIGYAF